MAFAGRPWPLQARADDVVNSRRRAVLIAGGAWLTSVVPAFSQNAKSLRKIAFAHPGSEAGYQYALNAFRAALKDLGYVEGRDVLLDVRWANDKTERLPNLAAEVVGSGPDVIVTVSSAAVAAFKKATATTPIVFATAARPVEQGLISSLQHPGGNVTGVVTYAELLNYKIIEVAHEALPAARRLAILLHEPDPAHKAAVAAFEQNARRYKLEPFAVRMSRPAEFARVFRELAEHKVDALVIPSLAFFQSNSSQLIEHALEARIPLLSQQSLITENGGLLSYGVQREENYRRAAALVDKILQGAKAGDLPVEQPSRLFLVVNLKTAKAIGVTLSPLTMLRADRIIQ